MSNIQNPDPEELLKEEQEEEHEPEFLPLISVNHGPNGSAPLWCYNKAKVPKEYREQGVILAEDYYSKKQGKNIFKFVHFANHDDALKFILPRITTNDLNMYNTITESTPMFPKPVRPYLDIDHKINEPDDNIYMAKLEEIKAQIITLVPRATKAVYGINLAREDYIIFDSSRDDKISFHVEFQNHYCETITDASYLATYITGLGLECDTIYNNKWQNFRLPFAHKFKTANNKIPTPMQKLPPNRYFITDVRGAEKLTVVNREKVKKYSAIIGNSKAFDPETVDEKPMEAVREYLPNSEIVGCGRICRVTWNGDTCPICDRIHNSEHGFLFMKGPSVILGCNRAPFEYKTLFDGIKTIESIGKFPRENYVLMDFFEENRDKVYASIEEARAEILESAQKCIALFCDTGRSCLVRVQKGEEFQICGFKGLCANWNDQFCYVVETKDDNDKPEKKQYQILSFLNNESAITYTGTEVLPAHDFQKSLDLTAHIPGAFNVFSGFRAKYVNEPSPEALEGVKAMLDHIYEVWCDEDQEIYDYVIAWLADCIKNPSEKCGTALAVIGKQGCGKGVVSDFENEYVYGEDLSIICNGMAQLTNRFNSDMMNVISVTVDELSQLSGDYHANADKLKNIITDKKLRLERKGIDPRRIQNNMRLRFFSNYEYSLKIEQDDRRYLVLKCSDRYVKKDDDTQEQKEAVAKYHTDLRKKCMNQDTGDYWYTYLYNFEHSIDLTIPPMTEIKSKLVQNNLPKHDIFIRALLAGEIEEMQPDDEAGICTTPIKPLYQAYVDWFAKNCTGSRLASTNFTSAFKDMTGLDQVTKKLDGKNVRVYKIPIKINDEETTEPVKLEPVKPEPAKPEPAKPEPAKPEPAKPEPVKPEPAKPEPVKPRKATTMKIAKLSNIVNKLEADDSERGKLIVRRK